MVHLFVSITLTGVEMSTTTPTKREIIEDFFQNNPEMIDQTVAEIGKSLKKKKGIEVARPWLHTIRKEFREQEAAFARNGRRQNAADDQSTNAAAQDEQGDLPNHGNATYNASIQAVVIDFQTMDTQLDVMCDVSSIASRVGGMQNLLVLVTKMQGMGIK
jgi:hypothetical protein